MKILQCGNNFYADYVVVGTGPAGATFDKILTDDFKTSVIGLEAGDYQENDPVIREARYNRVILSDYWPYYGWLGQSLNDPFAANRNFLWPQEGRLVGGGSAINNMNMVKASVANLSQWESLLGSFWSVDNIYAAYKAVENFIGVSSDPASRGTGGPVQILQVPQSGPLPGALKITSAMTTATGIGPVVDYNAPATPIGQSPTWQVAEFPNGIRSDATTSYLNASVVTQTEGLMYGVNGRRLAIFLRSTATQILFKGNKAKGIRFIRDGQEYHAYGSKGVIISAGVLSPQLLQVSGIGPAAVLATAGVKPVVVNENVGANFINHTALGITWTKNPADVLTDPANPGATTTVASLLPDPSGIVNPGIRDAQIIYQDGLQPGGSIQINPAVMVETLFHTQPFSRGYLQIDSKDPLKSALVQYNYFQDARDVQFYVDALRKYVAPFRNAIHAIDPLYELVTPSYDLITNPARDAELRTFIRANARQTHHGTGTDRMAPADQGGVVDQFGRVYGTRNLMVVDVTIFPYETDGNTAFTVFAVGYRLATWLRDRGFITSEPSSCDKKEWKCCKPFTRCSFEP